MSRAGGDGTAALERAGAETVKRAVELDLASRFQESLVCYQEGIDLLLQVVKGTKDEAKKQRYRQKISEYMTRAEDIKKHIEKEKQDGKYHKQIRIEENATGFGYEKLFQEYLTEIVSEVWVEDPYIRQVHQASRYSVLHITESVRLEKTSQIIQSNLQPIPTMPTDQAPQCHIYVFLEHLQGR